jgi:quinoprotein glucose dehydrogenase
VRVRIFALVIFLIAVPLVVGGYRLLTLGGSIYYLLAGAAMIGTGVLLWRHDARAEKLYSGLLLVTLLWALWESGLNPWALAARTLSLAVIGFGFAAVGNRPGQGLRPWPPGRWAGASGLLCIIATGLSFIPFQRTEHISFTPGLEHAVPVTAASGDEDWRNYGNGLSGTRFSRLMQITPRNVAQLEPAWIYRSGEYAAAGAPPGNAESTPLKVGELVYTCTPRNVVIAIDARKGTERWRFDPHASVEGHVFAVCRGVAYYHGNESAGFCSERIISTSPNGELIALDALRGELCPDFGKGGRVSLLSDLGEVDTAQYFTTSPPTIVATHVVVGGLILDNISTDMPSGVIRSFDAVSGKLQWAWDMGAPERIHAPENGGIYTRSTANSWTVFAADESLGMIYVPLGNPSPDQFGAYRRGFDEKYGSAVVALDISTGRPRWLYQTVHHDLWDYDLPAQPVLVDIPSRGGSIPGLIQATKRGEIFVLDRRDGKPIVPVSEKPVPQGAVAGDWTSPTQPFSALSAAPKPLTEVAMWGLTPIDQMACRIAFRRSGYRGAFTPPTLLPGIQDPGLSGALDWGGLSVDEDRKIFVFNTSDIPWMLQLRPRVADPDPHPATPMLGTPYTAHAAPFLGPLRAPCTQPPWGYLHAIDLRNNEPIWRHILGTSRDTGPLGLRVMPALAIGALSSGGTITTRSGLIFVGATTDQYLRAFDLQNGNELWRARLPAGGQATPMTYMSQGKQFVVITAGGYSVLGTKTGDYTIAYALPDKEL